MRSYTMKLEVFGFFLPWRNSKTHFERAGIQGNIVVHILIARTWYNFVAMVLAERLQPYLKST